MKTAKILAVTVSAVVLTAVGSFADSNPPDTAPPATTTTAPDTTYPIQLALAPPVELVNQDYSINGLRLNIYGSNKNVFGVDIGLMHETVQDFHGVAFGLLSFVHNDARGLQFDGIYSGVDKRMSGLQVGIVNHAGDMHGLQIGLANFADDATGIQIGLWNEIKSKSSWSVIPIINAAF
jgi:hypothetical protein